LRGREIRLLRVVRTGVGVGDVPPGTVAAAGEGELQVACGDEWLIVRRVLVDGRIVRPFEVVSAGDRLE
jgi:hypothetical protein